MRKLIFRVHAIQKMFERHISQDNVQEVIKNGEITVNIQMIHHFQVDSFLAG